MCLFSSNMAPKYASMSSSNVQLKKQQFLLTLERKLTVWFAEKQYVCLHWGPSWGIFKGHHNYTWLTSSLSCSEPNPWVRRDFPAGTMGIEKSSGWERYLVGGTGNTLWWLECEAQEGGRSQNWCQGSGLTTRSTLSLHSPILTKRWEIIPLCPHVWTL